MTDVSVGRRRAAQKSVAPKPKPPIVDFVSRFAESWSATIGLTVFAIVILAAIFAPLIAPQDPYDLSRLSILDSRLPPGSEGPDGHVFWLGTDGLGRDVFSAILYGLRISLAVGVMSAVFALLIGTSLGLTGAYFGGRLDSIIMRLVDLQMSFPPILVALILLSILGRGAEKTMIALIAVQWAYYARTVRAAALAERSKEYMDAARCLRLGHIQILTRHLLPNCLPPLLVVLTVQMAHAVTLEATLSFLGIGLPETQPSLGLLIANGFRYLINGTYWISIFPGIALLIVILSINLVGDQLRDMLNPRLSR